MQQWDAAHAGSVTPQTKLVLDENDVKHHF